MNWLYFFIGTTSAWVFMGIFIAVWSVVDPKRSESNKMNQRLLGYWEESERLKNLEIEELRDIANAVRHFGPLK